MSDIPTTPHPRASLTVSPCSSHGRVSCEGCSGRAATEWGVLSPEELREVEAGKSHNVYTVGQVLYYQGSPALGLHCIESGQVVRRRTDERGHETVLGLTPPHQTLGYRAFFGTGIHEETAMAATDCHVCFVDRSVVRSLCAKDPALGLAFLEHATRDLQQAEEGRVSVATQPIRRRLAQLLVILKDRTGVAGPDGVLVFDLPLSRQDIASLLGARPETIARTVRALEDDGVAQFDGRTVRVPDLDLLLDELDLPE